jgi:hypothetical protein
VSHNARFDLAARSDRAVRNSTDYACRILANHSPTEPDLVLSFFLHGLEQIESDWNARLSSWNLSVKLSGVFSHQTPKVEPQSMPGRTQAPVSGTCELGDLMVVVIHDGMPGGTGNALMFQAKKEFYHSADPLQRFLYEQAEEFIYKRATAALNGQRRDMRPKEDLAYAYWDLDPDHHIYRGLHPLLWNRGTSASMFAADSMIGRDVWDSFGAVLTDLIFGDAGKSFCLPAATDGWSKIVHDLLTVTSSKVMGSKSKVNVRGAKRGRGTDAVVRQLIASQGVPVRNSLGEALLHLSEEFKPASIALDKVPGLEVKDAGGDGPELPPLREADDPDGDGGSLLIIHCKG